MLDPRNVKPGNEQFEEFYALGLPRTDKNKRVQYDYRHTNGKLFSTIALTLAECRQRRDNWIEAELIRERMTRAGQ